MTSIQRYLELRGLVDVLYDVQDVRMRTANRLRLMPKETANLRVAPLLKLETDLTKEIDVILQDEPVYQRFLGKVRGVGPRIAGSIIAQTMIRFVRVSADEYESMSHVQNDTQRDVASHRIAETHSGDASQKADDTHFGVAFSVEQLRLAQKTEKGDYLIPTLRGVASFDTVSKYWAWFGLHVVDGSAAKRRKGENVNWNPKMRTLAWKIGKQFVLQGQGYRQIYDQEKDRLNEERMPLGQCPQYEQCKSKLKNRATPACKGHIDAMARRKTVKLFLSHLWQTWRQLEGLPTRPPYAMEYKGHNGSITPEQILAQEETNGE